MSVRTVDALAGALRDVRGAWTRTHTAVALVIVLAALVPLVGPAWVHVDSLAGGLYLALAATGLWIALGAGSRVT